MRKPNTSKQRQARHAHQHRPPQPPLKDTPKNHAGIVLAVAQIQDIYIVRILYYYYILVMNKLAIRTEKAPSAFGPYSQGVVTLDGRVIVSGQIGVTPDKKLAGLDALSQTRQALKNIGAILGAVSLGPMHITGMDVFIDSPRHFAGVNQAFEEFFDEPYPARTCVVAEVPLGDPANPSRPHPGYLVEMRAFAQYPMHETAAGLFVPDIPEHVVEQFKAA